MTSSDTISPRGAFRKRPAKPRAKLPGLRARGDVPQRRHRARARDDDALERRANGTQPASDATNRRRLRRRRRAGRGCASRWCDAWNTEKWYARGSWYHTRVAPPLTPTPTPPRRANDDSDSDSPGTIGNHRPWRAASRRGSAAPPPSARGAGRRSRARERPGARASRRRTRPARTRRARRGPCPGWWFRRRRPRASRGRVVGKRRASIVEI